MRKHAISIMAAISAMMFSQQQASYAETTNISRMAMPDTFPLLSSGGYKPYRHSRVVKHNKNHVSKRTKAKHKMRKKYNY
jgi:hypothetical protein